MTATSDKVRIDRWLWAARFFKTRSLAGKAVSGGHVYVNGKRVKAARPVRVGDSLQIRRGHLEFDVVVLGVSGRRGPATVARTLYEETGESIRRREQAALERRFMRPEGTAPTRRPDKRERRKIRRLLRKE